MRERGKYQIQCMKSRSSTGVGQKIDLEYNIETMRITDDDPDGYADQQAKYKPNPSPSPAQLIDKFKPELNNIDESTGEIIEPEQKKIVADVQATKLKKLLNSLKK
jgi:hypothetical protein